MPRGAPNKPVAIWHDLAFAGYLTSEHGPITDAATADLHHRHCPSRSSCAVLRRSLGRCLLLSAKLLAELADGSGRYHNLHASLRSGFVEFRADHVDLGGECTSRTYRLLPIRWRDTDPADHIDPDLCLGIWPD